MPKAKPHPDQMGFAFEAPKPAIGEAALAGVEQRICRMVGTILNGDSRPREVIAAEMSVLLGEDVSRAMLDAYSSPARNEHKVPLSRLLALIAATSNLLDPAIAAGERRLRRAQIVALEDRPQIVIELGFAPAAGPTRSERGQAVACRNAFDRPPPIPQRRLSDLQLAGYSADRCGFRRSAGNEQVDLFDRCKAALGLFPNAVSLCCEPVPAARFRGRCIGGCRKRPLSAFREEPETAPRARDRSGGAEASPRGRRSPAPIDACSSSLRRTPPCNGICQYRRAQMGRLGEAAEWWREAHPADDGRDPGRAIEQGPCLADCRVREPDVPSLLALAQR